ncbi:hypothetical protein [Bizionia saleffrena]|uniref:hypothetical protein n=1 Tax=Bizionia saleffrena TaxID=291189 RepID=UPI001FECA6D8|nr:hypothetical protein [Bizionia saleffrena]
MSRVHQFVLPSVSAFCRERLNKTVSLTSSSGAVNISIGSKSLFKELKAISTEFNAFDFRVLQDSEFL